MFTAIIPILCNINPCMLSFIINRKKKNKKLPGCSKRKSGKSISVEEQQIILNVAKYFQEESKVEISHNLGQEL